MNRKRMDCLFLNSMFIKKTILNWYAIKLSQYKHVENPGFSLDRNFTLLNSSTEAMNDSMKSFQFLVDL